MMGEKMVISKESLCSGKLPPWYYGFAGADFMSAFVYFLPYPFCWFRRLGQKINLIWMKRLKPDAYFRKWLCAMEEAEKRGFTRGKIVGYQELLNELKQNS